MALASHAKKMAYVYFPAYRQTVSIPRRPYICVGKEGMIMQQERIAATVTILTYNSAPQVRRCLESVRAFDEILVIDGGSTDGTLDIAHEFGATILSQSDVPGPIDDFTVVRTRSFKAAKFDWVFWIDSDEYADEKLIEDIHRAVLRNQSSTAFRASKIPIVSGNIIEHAYFLPDYVLRLVHRTSAHWAKGKKVHEHIKVDEGVETQDLDGAVYTPWGSVEEQKNKDSRYIHLAFNKPVLKRPRISVVLRSVLKNLIYATWIFCIAVYITIRYGYTRKALPFRHHLRFSRYHLLIIKERFRQLTLGTRYEPPQA